LILQSIHVLTLRRAEAFESTLKLPTSSPTCNRDSHGRHNRPNRQAWFDPIEDIAFQVENIDLDGDANRLNNRDDEELPDRACLDRGPDQGLEDEDGQQRPDRNQNEQRTGDADEHYDTYHESTLDRVHTSTPFRDSVWGMCNKQLESIWHTLKGKGKRRTELLQHSYENQNVSSSTSSSSSRSSNYSNINATISEIYKLAKIQQRQHGRQGLFPQMQDAQTGRRRAGSMPKLVQRLKSCPSQQWNHISSGNVARLSWALGKAREPSNNLTSVHQGLNTALRSLNMSDFQTWELVSVMWGQSLCLGSESSLIFFEKFCMEASRRNLSCLPSRQLASLAWSIGYANLASAGSKRLTNAIAAQVSFRGTESFQPAELSNMIFCLFRGDLMNDGSLLPVLDSMLRQVDTFCAQRGDKKDEAGLRICLLLRETNHLLITRIVESIGVAESEKILLKAIAIEKSGGQQTEEKISRRRLPGGVFLKLLKSSIPKDAWAKIRGPSKRGPRHKDRFRSNKRHHAQNYLD